MRTSRTYLTRVTVGQRWRRKRDGVVIELLQVHRKDVQVEYAYEVALALEPFPRRHLLSIPDLRQGFERLVSED